VIGARHALQRALYGRREDVVLLPANHYSPDALGAIVLVTTALEVSMNEAIAMGAVFGAHVARDQALPPTCAKFANVASGSEGFDAAAVELRLLVDLRDEIVHYLPRVERSAAGNVPEWCEVLHERGLFIEAPGGDFQFCQKIPSYALAYWAFGVAYETICMFVGSLPAVTQNVCDYLPHNFSLYQQIYPPEALGEFDAAHGLEVTVFDVSAPSAT
jgi:hypothetical protein